ncbi:unnamed protein product [Gordionus sp. m RMFG-2023]
MNNLLIKLSLIITALYIGGVTNNCINCRENSMCSNGNCGGSKRIGLGSSYQNMEMGSSQSSNSAQFKKQSSNQLSLDVGGQSFAESNNGCSSGNCPRHRVYSNGCENCPS